jgi:hypothetical protein
MNRITQAIVVLAACACVVPPDLPAQESRSLPDAESLYKAVRGNLARAEREVYRYAFKERRTDIHTNPFGKIGTGGTRVLEVYPSPTPRLTYRRVVERDGMRISAADLAEQDRQYRLRVAEVRRRASQESSSERRTREEEIERARQRGQRRIDDVVDTLEFKVDSRVMFNGVPAILITFAPRPGAKPSTREGKIAQKFAGTVWVDGAASEVMQVEAKSIDVVSYGFGMVVRVSEGATATLTRQPVEGGIWMPTKLTLAGHGRAAVVRRFVIDVVNEWFDYRRLPGDSSTPFLDNQINPTSQ